MRRRRPSLERIRGLTFGTVTEEQRRQSRTQLGLGRRGGLGPGAGGHRRGVPLLHRLRSAHARFRALSAVDRLAAGPAGLGGAFRAGRRRRLVENLPTSKTTGVFIGLVELKGTAESASPLTSYLAEQPCVEYQWSVEEHWSRTVTETYTDSDGKTQTRTRHESGWTTVASGGEMIPFYLQDDCGVILVRPEGAKLEPAAMFDETVGRGDPLYYAKGPAGAVADSDHRRRFVERGIPLHAMLYVMGQARERQDVVAPEIAQDRRRRCS